MSYLWKKARQGFASVFSIEVPAAKEAYLLLGASLVLYLYVALISFNPWDASRYSASIPSRSIENLTGSIGAELGSWLIYHLGLGAWLVPLPLAYSLFGVYRHGKRLISSFRFMGWSFLILATVALVWHLSPQFTQSQVAFRTGGILGQFLHQYGHRLLGPVGYGLFFSLMFVLSLMVLFDFSLLGILQKCGLSIRQAGLLLKDKLMTRKNGVEASFPRGESSAPVVEVNRLPADLEVRTEENEDHESVMPADQKHWMPPPNKSRLHKHQLEIGMFKGAELSQEIDQKELQAVGALITQVFSEFGIKGEVIGFQPGPVVTVYEFQPEPGIKQARILTLIDDIALALKVDSIFIFPVKGKRALGVQVPNRQRQTAYLRNILESDAFKMASSPLTMAMGLSIAGEPICADLCAMPHLLMAGATGAGKSVAINTMLTSVIAKSGPEDVRMILVDPKMLELSVYEGIPHLLMPVITDVERAAMALKWAVSEMERRYKIMQLLAVRNIASFNESWRGLSETEKEALRQEVGAVDDHGLPMILIVIDELADLMMMAPKEVENCIQRLAQKARASGIHMILATQRPSVDIITGVIKANLPCRIAFQVVSRHDSRTILDQVGAEKLLGKGDMLYMRPGTQRFERIQGALVSDQEVIQFVRQFQAQVDPAYRDDVIQWIEEELVKTQNPTGEPGETTDGDEPKWDEAVGIAETQGSISASFLQRRMKIGYNRAARIVEQMESMGLVEKGAGSKPRAWLGR